MMPQLWMRLQESGLGVGSSGRDLKILILLTVETDERSEAGEMDER